MQWTGSGSELLRASKFGSGFVPLTALRSTLVLTDILVTDSGRARFIKDQIESGKITFANAAKEYSTCPSASKGGDLGTFAPGAMVGAFNDYCFDEDTKLNELGVVRTSFGTHIIKLTKKP